MNPVTGGVGFEETSVAHYTSEKYQDVVFDFYMSLDKQATRADITRITRRLGDDIAAVYGFHIPRQKQSKEIAR